MSETPQGYSGPLPAYYVQSSTPQTPNLGLTLVGIDPIVAYNFVLIDNNSGGGGGSVKVNGATVTNPNFNGTTPAAGAGFTNVTFQVSGSNVSAELLLPANTPAVGGQALASYNSTTGAFTTVAVGSGTVTSFSAGNLSPLFTTSVATATTTPALTFALTNAGGGTVFGNSGTSSGAPAYTIAPQLGVPGTSTGTIALASSTASGLYTITAPANAATPTLTLPTGTGTFAVTASSPIVLNATTGNLTAPTAVTSASSLTSNAVVLGAGGQATQTLSAFTTDGVTQLNIGPADTTNNGILGLKGKTSGTATFTAPAVAGTSTNGIVCSNNLLLPAGTQSAPAFSFSGGVSTGFSSLTSNEINFSNAGVQTLSLYGGGPVLANLPNTGIFAFTSGSASSTGQDTGISRLGAGSIAFGNASATSDTSANLSFNTVIKYGGSATVGQGVPSEIVLSDLTAQSAAITATNIIASAPRTGMYKVIWSATITTADGVSSVLGGTNGFQVVYTSPTDSVTKTTVPGNSVTSSANTTGTAVGGVEVIYAKTATAIQYKYDYTSATPGQMVYELHIRLVAL